MNSVTVMILCKDCKFYVRDYSFDRNCTCPKMIPDKGINAGGRPKVPMDGVRVEATGEHEAGFWVMPEFGCIHGKSKVLKRKPKLKKGLAPGKKS